MSVPLRLSADTWTEQLHHFIQVRAVVQFGAGGWGGPALTRESLVNPLSLFGGSSVDDLFLVKRGAVGGVACDGTGGVWEWVLSGGWGGRGCGWGRVGLSSRGGDDGVF